VLKGPFGSNNKAEISVYCSMPEIEPDFIIESPPLTKRDKEEISDFIRKSKEKLKKEAEQNEKQVEKG
jgi:hypothetical protein